MRLYKKKIAYLSDRYSKFELNVLDYLRTAPRVIVPNFLLVKNLVDDELIVNANTLSFFTYDDGTQEILQFVALLTEKGRSFIESWTDEYDDAWIIA
jgi:hypothetical protein